ncbi:hypothetical protein DPEC_G00044090 [Dallia pectoralis]|uniref:Uncharacterized protein n=1 Tax=Dallia pectoralis TaxID=75939 RepID=A0ACC2H9D9_DALPE|nr:hypothetical protein DPEC_G00044090 [Dallia pectoralis]
MSAQCVAPPMTYSVGRDEKEAEDPSGASSALPRIQIAREAGEVAGERKAVAMTTSWQLLSPCVPRALAVPSLPNAWE